MPINFSYNHTHHYLQVSYIGKITDDMLLNAWTLFFKGVDEVRGVNVLADLSLSDFSEVSMEAIEKLTRLTQQFHHDHQIQSVKVANVSSKPLNFGMARAYEGLATGSVEIIQTFRNIEDAEAWLAQTEEN